MIFLPPAMVWVGLKVTGYQTDEKMLCKCPVPCLHLERHLTSLHPDLHVYPGICTLTAGILAAVAAIDIINSWSQTVRDKEFLVAMRLQNLEPGAETKGDLESPGDMSFADEDEAVAVDEEDEE
jgi:E3 ubiquitin-protein ligase MARCH6